MGYEIAKAWVTVGADTAGFRPEAESALLQAINGLTSSIDDLSERLGFAMGGAIGKGMLDGLKESKGPLLDAMQEIGSLSKMALDNLGIKFDVQELFNIGRESISEAQTAIAAEKKLNNIVELQGEKAKGTAEEYQKLGDAIAENTQFDGAEIKTALAQLVPYGFKLEELNKIMMSSADIQALYGGNVNQMSQDIANALYSPLSTTSGLGMLQKKGFKLTPEQIKAKDAAIAAGDKEAAKAVIWDVLSGQEGLAKKMSQDPAIKAQKEMANLKEELGRKLLPIQQSLTAVQNDLTKAMIGFLSVMAPVIKGVVDLVTAFGGFGVKVLLAASAIGTLILHWRTITASFSAGYALLLNPWAWIAVAIAVAVAGIVQFIQWLSTLQAVQDAWASAIHELGIAWEAFSSAVITAGTEVVTALDAAFGGFFSNLFGWFAEGNATAGAFFGGMITYVTDWIVGTLEWMAVLLEGWRILWDNMGAILMASLSAIWDIFSNLAEFIPQAFGYALRKAFDYTVAFIDAVLRGFVWLLEQIGTLIMRIPELMTRGVMGEDIQSIVGEMFNVGIKAAQAFGKGLQGEAPDVEKLFSLSSRTRNQFAELASGPLKELVDHKRELEMKRKAGPADPLAAIGGGALSLAAGAGGAGGEKPAAAAAIEAAIEKPPPWYVEMGQGRFGFADLGRKIQDQLLGKDKDKKVDKQIAIAEQGNQLQQQQLKQLETIATKPDGGLT